MGVTIVNADGTVKSTVGEMPVETKQDAEAADKSLLVLGRPLHVTADGKVVEEDDPLGIAVLGGKGSVMTAAQVARYGLNDSHRESVPRKQAVAVPVEEPVAPEPEMPEPVIEAPEPADEPSEPAPKKAKK